MGISFIKAFFYVSYRIGSDEDEDEADESQSMEDPSETAVSRDNKLEHSQPVHESSASGESESQQREAESTPVKENNATAEEEKEADTQQQPETSEADGTVTGGTTPVKIDALQEEVSQVPDLLLLCGCRIAKCEL